MRGSLIVDCAIGEPLLSFVKNLGGEDSQAIFVAVLYLVAILSRLFIFIKEVPNNRQRISIPVVILRTV